MSLIQGSDYFRSKYNAGKVFRTFYEINLPNNGRQVFRFRVTGDATLLSSTISLDDGGIIFKAYSGGIESGTFTDLTSFPVNNKSGMINQASLVTLGYGGDVDTTGLSPNDVSRVKSGQSKESTVNEADDNVRSFGAGDYYATIETIDGLNSTSTGTIKWQWHNG